MTNVIETTPKMKRLKHNGDSTHIRVAKSMVRPVREFLMLYTGNVEMTNLLEHLYILKTEYEEKLKNLSASNQNSKLEN